MQKTILVVDADTSTQLVLFRLLAEAGYAVSSAAEGAEAVAKIEAECPGLILANVDLPGKSGVEICRYAKARERPIAVALLAPGVEPGPIEPADAVLGTPIDTTRVLETVRAILHGGDDEPADPAARILVVDDDVGMRRLMENILAREGHTPIVAGSGREGLAVFEAERPDLVLLDVQMPGMNGFEVLTKMRESRSDVPVIMVTAYGSEQVAADALRLGADDYVAKPLRVPHIAFRIQRNLEKARLRASQRRLNQQLRRTTLELVDRLQQVVEVNAAFRRTLHRVLGDLRERLETEGASRQALAILDRLRVVSQPGHDAAPHAAIAAAFGEADPSPTPGDPQPPAAGGP